MKTALAMRLRPLRHWLRALLAAAAAAGAGLSPACDLQAPAAVPLGFYQASSPVSTARPLGIRLRAGGAGTCSGTLQAQWAGVNGELLLQGPGGDLRVALTLDAAGTAALPAAPQDALAVQAAAGLAQDIPLWVRVLPGQWLAPGTYQAPLRLRVLDARGGTLDERELSLWLVVEAVVRAGFSGGADRSARLDFGELAQGARRAALLDVQANTAYRMTLQSTQRGRLVNRRYPDSSVPYVLRVGGRAMPLAAGAAGLEQPVAGRVQHAIEAEIGPVERVLAGDYADDLLITIEAR